MKSEKSRKSGRGRLPAGNRVAGPSPSWWPTLRYDLLIAVAVFAVFAMSLQGQFLTWDDRATFITNQHFRGFAPEQLRWMWSTTYMGHWVPVTWMSLGVDFLLWGLNPVGFHLSNIVLHGLNAILVFHLVKRVLALAGQQGSSQQQLLASLVASLFFALHPLRVESVAWMTERRDVLSLAFYLGSLLAYVRSRELNGSRRWYASSLALFVLAILSKATAVTLPVALLLLDVYLARALARHNSLARTGTRLLPYFVLSAAAGLRSIFALSAGSQLSLAQKVGVSLYGLAFYFWKTIVPVNLSPLYEFPRPLDLAAPPFLAGYATILVVAALVVTQWKRMPALSWSLLAFAALTFPLLGMVQNGPQIVADRYTYQSSVALSMIVAGGLLWQRRHWRVLLPVASVILCVLAALSVQQSKTWLSSDALWRRVVEVDGRSAIGHHGLGTQAAIAGDVDGAMREYRTAITLNAAFADPHNDLGLELFRLGRNDEAMREFRAAIMIKPEFADAEINLGNSLVEAGDWSAAVEHYAKAANDDPTHPGAEYDWGLTLANAGELERAIPHLERAVTLAPADADARTTLDRVRSALAAHPR